MKEMKYNIDWDKLDVIIKQCPEIPLPPVVEQINPPPYTQSRVLLGLAVPDDDEEKKDKKPAKPAPKKGYPEKQIKWADSGPIKKKVDIEYIDDAR